MSLSPQPGYSDDDLAGMLTPATAKPKAAPAPEGFSDSDIAGMLAPAPKGTPVKAVAVPTPVHVPLTDRFMANFTKNADWTAQGAAANLLSDTMTQRTMRTLHEWGDDEAAERYKQDLIKGELIRRERYANLPAWNAPGTPFVDKVLGGGAALTGSFATAVLSPEGMINKIPFMNKIAPAVSRATSNVVGPLVEKLLPRGAAIVRRDVAPVVGRVAEAGATQGTIMGGLDPAVQLTDMLSGKSDQYKLQGNNYVGQTADYDPMQTVHHALFGALLGAGIHGGGEALGASINAGRDAIANAFSDWRIKRSIALHMDQPYGPPTQDEALAFAASPQGQAVRQQFVGPPQAPPVASMRDQILQPDARVPVTIENPMTAPARAGDLRAATAEAPAIQPTPRPMDEAPPVQQAAASPVAVKAPTIGLPERPGGIDISFDEPPPVAPKEAPVVKSDEISQPVAQPAAQPKPKEAPAAQPKEATPEHVEEVDGAEAAYQEAVRHAQDNPSTSYIQRKMQLPYKEASTLMARMEDEGLVSPPNSKGVRTYTGEKAEAPVKEEAPASTDPTRQGIASGFEKRTAEQEATLKAEAEARAAAKAAKPAAKVAKAEATGSHNVAAPRVKGRYTSEEGGHVANERGEPIKFPSKAQAEKFANDAHEKTNQKQDFDVVPHPSEKGKWTVKEHAEAPITSAPEARGAKAGKSEPVPTTPPKAQPKPAVKPEGKAAKAKREAAENEAARGMLKRDLRASSTAKEGKGDVMMADGKYVPFDKAVKATRDAIAAGMKPWPAQLHFELGTAMRDVDRVLAEVNKPVKKTRAKPLETVKLPQRSRLVTEEEMAAAEAEIGDTVNALHENGDIDASTFQHADDEVGQTGQEETASPAVERESEPVDAEATAEQPADRTGDEGDAGGTGGETGSIEPGDGNGVGRDREAADRGRQSDEPGSEEPASGEGSDSARPEQEDIADATPEEIADATPEDHAAAEVAAEDMSELEAGYEDVPDAPGGTPREKVEANARLRNTFYSNPFTDPQIWRDLADTLVKVFGWPKGLAKAMADSTRETASKFNLDPPQGTNFVSKTMHRVRPMMGAIETILRSKDGQMRSWAVGHGSKAMMRAADMFFPKGEGVGRWAKDLVTAKKEDYFTATLRWTNKWSDQFTDAVRFIDDLPFANRADAMKQIGKLVQNPKNIVKGTQYGDAALAIAQIFKEAHAYAKAAGLEMGEVKDGYLPRIENVEEVLKRKTEFLAKAEQAYVASGYNAKDAKEGAQEWFQRIVAGDIGLTKEGLPLSQRVATPSNFTKGRTLTKAADNIMDSFYYQNVADIVPHYIDQVVRKAEYSRRLGRRDAGAPLPHQMTPQEEADWRADPNGKWFDLVKEFEAEGHADRVHVLHGFIRKMTGDYGAPPGGYTPLAGAAVWLRTGNILGKLQYSVLSSLTEPMTPAVHTGNPLHAVGGILNVARHWTPILNKWGTDYTNDWLHALNLLGDTIDGQSATQMTGGQSGRLAADHLVGNMFKMTGQSGFSEATRKSALDFGMIFVDSLARSAAKPGGKLVTISERILKDFGVRDPAGFAQYMRQRNRMPSPAEVATHGQHGEDYALFLTNFIHRNVMHPTSAMKPYYDAHPVGALVYSLQSFLMAFGKQVVMPVARSTRDALDIPIKGISKGNDLNPYERIYAMGPAANFMAMAALSYAIGWGRDEALPDPQQKGNKPMTTQRKIIRAVSRTGTLAQLDPVANMFTQSRYKTDTANAVLGATLGPLAGLGGAGIDVVRGMIDDDVTGSNRNRNRALATATWDVLAKPMLQGLVAGTLPLKGKYRTAGKWIGRALTYALADKRTRATVIDTVAGKRVKAKSGGGSKGLY